MKYSFAFAPLGAGFDQSQQHARCAGRSSVLRWSGSPRPRLCCSRLEIRGPVRGVGLRVQLDAEPRGGLADAAADLGGVLADAGGEHQRVDPAEHGGERADLLGRAVDEVVDAPAARRARCLPSRSRMSLLMPEMPSRPDFL